MPDPPFPFLGVHLTRMINGSVHAGPNAIFALAREGYTKLTINPRDVLDSLRQAMEGWESGSGVPDSRRRRDRCPSSVSLRACANSSRNFRMTLSCRRMPAYAPRRCTATAGW